MADEPPVGYYTDEHGVVRPITAPKDNSAPAVIGAAVFLVVSALVGGTAGTVAALGSTTTVDSVVGQSIEARTTNGKESARRGLYEETWKRLRLKSLRQTLRQINRDFRCALRSTGQVQQFFVREPCRSLRRTLIPLADADGNTIIVGIAWVRMYTTGSATRLAELIDADGTGGIQPIADPLLEYNGIVFTGQNYAVRRNGTLVVIAEATPWRGQPDGAVLDSIALVAAEFPEP